MCYKFKVFKLNIEIEGNSYCNQIEILPRLTVIYGTLKLVAFEWLYWSLSIEFFKK